MKLKIGSVYLTANEKFIKIINLWSVGAKSDGLGDTSGECLLSTSPGDFTDHNTMYFTKYYVKKEITKEEYPEYYL